MGKSKPKPRRPLPGEAEDDYVNYVRGWFRADQRPPARRGPKSVCFDVMVLAHLALRELQGPITTQAALRKAAEQLNQTLHEYNHESGAKRTDLDLISPKKIKEFVGYYLRLRQGVSKEAMRKFPLYVQEAIDRLPSGIHADILMGLLGTSPAAKLITPATRTTSQIVRTQQIRRIKSLS